jgi:signal peptidase I
MRLPAAEIEAVIDQVRSIGGRIGFEADVWGTSMAPHIRHGDSILVESAAVSEIAVSDVIVYRGGHGRNVAHRVVRVEDRGDVPVLVTRSDAPGADDEPVFPEQVIGRVIGVERAHPLVHAVAQVRALVDRLVMTRR